MASGHKMPAVLADLEAVPGSDMCIYIYISVCGESLLQPDLDLFGVRSPREASQCAGPRG